MDKEKLIYRLFQVAAYGLTHKNYSHVEKKAKLYKQLVAGVGIDDLLKQYVRREDKELFKQRVQLTQHIVTSVCKNLMDVFYKIPRSNSARRVLTYTNENRDKLAAELEKLLGKFWGNASWDDYLATRFIELNSIDPNAFIVFEWDAFDNRKEMIQPRPFEVSSSAAVDFTYKNQVLQYLIVKHEHYYDTGDVMQIGENENTLRKPNEGKTKGEKYTLYGKDQTFQLLQISNKLVLQHSGKDGDIKPTNIKGQTINVVKLGEHFYQFVEYEAHNLDAVPAFRVGYYRDLATGGDTYVNPIHAAEPYILKTVKVNSEFDLVATLLAFPQQVKRGKACDDEKCYGGKYDDGSTCKTCEGQGVIATAPTAQDAILLGMPDAKEEMIPLEQIITYVSPPVDIVKWQEQYIENLTVKCKQIMFNSDIFTKAQVADTAQGKNLDMSNVYDTLHPFARRFAKIWVFGTTTFGKLADRGKDLVVNYTFGKDFKLKTLDSLIMDLSIANGLNNSSLVQHLNDDIAEIIFSEKPIDLQRYKIKQFYNPFNGKTDNEIQILLAGNLVPIKEKILHANFSNILDELELEYAEKKKNFYELKRPEQRKAIYDKVDNIIKLLAEENPTPELSLT